MLNITTIFFDLLCIITDNKDRVICSINLLKEDFIMENEILPKLLKRLEVELLRLGYSEGSMKFYRNRWQKLLKFAKEQNQMYFSEQLGIDFVETYFQIQAKDFEHQLCQKDTQELRVIRMVGDFQLHHTILRRYYKHHEILSDPYFVSISLDFRNYCVNKKDYSNVTVNHYVKQAERFMDYLISQRVTSCSQITLKLVHSYILTIAGYSYKTVEQIICAIRAFLRYLKNNDIILDDLAIKTPMIQSRKQTRIPSVWTKEELDALIKAIDRGNPKGKRDYAMILLASVLGLRIGDIKKLTLDCFNWRQNTLAFTQSKTREPIVLPLPTEVGWAIIDYLRYGRPNVETNIIFVRHIAPFLPFSEEDHLAQIIQGYMRIAHLPTLKKHRGMHSLRHTAASRMLEQGAPLSVISDILGHSDTDSTAVYLKVDMKRLKECCLNIPGGDEL